MGRTYRRRSADSVIAVTGPDYRIPAAAGRRPYRSDADSVTVRPCPGPAPDRAG